MIRQHAALYLGARAIAAVGNMFAVAVFTRLAGAEVYGGYLLLLATAGVVNGFAVQWVRYAFFANDRADGSAFVPTLLAMVGAALAAAAPIATLAMLARGSSPGFVAGALLMAAATGLFDTCSEVFRTRLDVWRVIVAGLMRTVLVVALGTAALLWSHDPVSLAVGVALANLLAAGPTLLAMRPLLRAAPSVAVARQYVAFGWPLILSFGIGAFAQSVDRFVLDAVGGAALVGPYGAASDFVRSSFLVVAEALASSMISIAKRQHGAGDDLQAQATLTVAYRLFVLLAGVGTAGFLMFGEAAFALIFPGRFAAASAGLLPVIVAAAVLLVIRNLYFGQVIYFNRASGLELGSTLILLVVNGSLCLLLIPRFGVAGAAWAFLSGQALSTAFVIAAGRRRFRMPVLWRPTLAVAAIVAGLVWLGWEVDRLGYGLWLGAAIKAPLFAVGAGMAAWSAGTLGAVFRRR